ncbi:hypothetical protein P7C73_g4692, partial [Tremellales sp. Uapishka_1]
MLDTTSSSSPKSPIGPLDFQNEAEGPPSYDSDDFLPHAPADAGSSSAGMMEHQRVIPPHLIHHFTTPPNCEPLTRREDLPFGLDAIDKTKPDRLGRVVSIDKRLEDPRTLYDFIQHTVLAGRQSRLRCIGSHIETHPRTEIVRVNGVPTSRTQGEKSLVTDFDFFIDFSSIINRRDTTNIHLSTVSPSLATMRGTYHRTYAAAYAPSSARQNGTNYQLVESGPTAIGRRATKRENKLQDSFSAWKLAQGLPEWLEMEDATEFWESNVSGKSKSKMDPVEGPSGEEEAMLGDGWRKLAQEKALMDWCEVYCADPGLLKRFVVNKSVWGWDMGGLKSAIAGAIRSTGYTDALTVEFDWTERYYVVKPNNLLTRAIHNNFVYFLLWITMIFPLILLFQRFHRLGGGVYDVVRADYSMKYYPPLPATFPTETIQAAQHRLPSLYKTHPEIPHGAFLQVGPKGIHYLVGMKEGQWMKDWEERIKMAARLKFQGELVRDPAERPGVVGRGLDGYED